MSDNKNKHPVKIHTLAIPPLCEVSIIEKFNQPLKPIGFCFYEEKAIYDFMMANGLYRLTTCWLGELEDWWLDGHSLIKTVRGKRDADLL